MNPAVTSKESILEVSRNLIMEKGSAINIREVASACGISVGSVYNYFGSKSELVAATVESVWEDIFQPSAKKEILSDFNECIRWIYGRIKWGNEKYPGFLAMHATNFIDEEKSKGRARMEQSWQNIQRQMLSVLKKDAKVRSDAFDRNFSEENFIKLVFSIIIAALLQKDYDCAPLQEMVKRTIY